jgi:hypothetical protein
MIDVITLTTGLIINYNIYVVLSSQGTMKKQHLERVKKSLNKFDLKEINRLIEIVKKEMIELPEKSSLSIAQKINIINYCELLILNYFEKDFTPERRVFCLKIKNYCNSI